MKRLLLALGVLVALGGPASADLAQDMAEARRECEGRVERLRTSAGRFRWIAIFVTAVGGLTAAASGLRAGATEGATSKKWGTVAFVSGLIAAASPAVPKPEDYEAKMATADRHRTMGLKLMRQLAAFTAEPSYHRQATQYVVARFTECAAEQPMKDVPDLPAGGPLTSVERAEPAWRAAESVSGTEAFGGQVMDRRAEAARTREGAVRGGEQSTPPAAPLPRPRRPATRSAQPDPARSQPREVDRPLPVPMEGPPQ